MGDWKPGDVAMVKHMDGTEARMMCQPDGTWACGQNTDGRAHSHRLMDDPIRELVVLDPDDVASLKPLHQALHAAFGVPIYYADLQDALRSLTTPPKPLEPTGLGAVVEDDEGERWVRGHASHVAPWLQVWTSGDTAPSWRYWSGIAAVRVLSEGVTP